MKSYTYPIVFIKNSETGMFNGFIPDLAVACEGSTMEDVIREAQAMIAKFFDLALKYKTDVPAPSALDTTLQKWQGYKVMYVTANVE